VQRLEKLLEDAGIKLSAVASDIVRVSEQETFASAAPRWACPCGAGYAHIPIGKGQVVF